MALAGCAQAPKPAPTPPAPAAAPQPAPAPAPAAAPPTAGAIASPTRPGAQGVPGLTPPRPAGTAARGPIPRNPRYVTLSAPATPRSQAALQAQFAARLMQAHPDSTYTGRPPERLYAIPVLEVDLNADGTVRGIKVLRRPSTGDEATRLAMDAVRRAAPYGDVSRLPKPWRVVETFLFDDDLRFKPRTLDVD
ncbi:energy transducer TonB [Rubrivivax rivuli]|uniref:Energy transducer TonB n=1 Tax=Rubrivivax rivuli TaxID=1862385 RepID=A0A437RG12_9BURK|nr:energy transducer TonB [Rubrivivax rivuli]